MAAHDCEIPAYAGMVYGGNGELRADLASPPKLSGVAACKKMRFLLSQEWSTGDYGLRADLAENAGRQFGEYGIVFALRPIVASPAA